MRTAAAIVLVMAAAAMMGCGGDDESDDGGEDAPTEAAATDSPTEATSGGGTGALTPGEHTTEEFATPATYTVGEGWEAFVDNPDFFVMERLRTAEEPVLFIAFLRPEEAYNPTETTLELGPAPADFAQWLQDHRLLEVVDMREVTLGGLMGTQFEVTTDTFSAVNLFKTSDGDFDLRFQDHISVAVLDAGDSQVLVMYGSDLPTDFDRIEADAEEVLASMEFGQ
jgi:hypothetical protein